MTDVTNFWAYLHHTLDSPCYRAFPSSPNVVTGQLQNPRVRLLNAIHPFVRLFAKVL